MLVKGKHILAQTLDIEVDPLDVLGQLEKHFTPDDGDFIRGRSIYKIVGVNHHRGEDILDKLRDVTDEEFKLYDAYKTVMGHLRYKLLKGEKL